MKLMYLNVDGVGEGTRFDKIVDFVRAENPDVLFLAELNGWEKNNFEILFKFKESINFSYHFFSESNTSHHLGVFSKILLENSESIKEKFHHSLIKSEINDIIFLFGHLDPNSEDKRKREIKEIFNIIKQFNSKKIVFLGDLNSLSPFDDYDEEKLIEDLKQINLTKFGISELRRDVQQKILNFGLIDSIKKFSDNFEYSVPTEFSKDKNHFSKLRLDYVYVNSNLETYVKMSKIIRNEKTNQLSDHFPLIIEFSLD